MLPFIAAKRLSSFPWAPSPARENLKILRELRVSSEQRERVVQFYIHDLNLTTLEKDGWSCPGQAAVFFYPSYISNKKKIEPPRRQERAGFLYESLRLHSGQAGTPADRALAGVTIPTKGSCPAPA